VASAAPILLQSENRRAVMSANDFAGAFGDDFQSFIEG